MAAYTLGRHFANSMQVPMQDCNELLLRCSPCSPEVPDSHPGCLHAAVRVMDNAWRDDGGLEMLQVLVEEMEAAGVQPAYTKRFGGSFGNTVVPVVCRFCRRGGRQPCQSRYCM